MRAFFIFISTLVTLVVACVVCAVVEEMRFDSIAAPNLAAHHSGTEP